VSEYVHKSHNVTVLIYHLVFPAKYRRAGFDEEVDTAMKEVCVEIPGRYQRFSSAVLRLRRNSGQGSSGLMDILREP